jgi:hypothetical protein
MNRNIAIAVAVLSLTALPAHADVQSSFPDGYVIVEADGAPNASLPWADVQASFPDGYVIVEAEAELRMPSQSHAELVGNFPQPSFIDYVAVKTRDAMEVNSLAGLESQTPSN